MSKIKIKVSFNNNEIDYINTYKAIYKDNEIVYKENENITMKYNSKNNILTRITPEFIADYYLNKGICLMNIKEYNKEIQIPIAINKLINNKNIIEIEYKIEEKTISYKIEIIE